MFEELLLTDKEARILIDSWTSADHTISGELERFIQYCCQAQLNKIHPSLPEGLELTDTEMIKAYTNIPDWPNVTSLQVNIAVANAQLAKASAYCLSRQQEAVEEAGRQERERIYKELANINSCGDSKDLDHRFTTYFYEIALIHQIASFPQK